MSQLASVRADGSRVPIHPSDVRGRFLTARRAGFAVLMVIYLAAPVVQLGGHPAVHLDVGRRRFYLLGGSFNAQDFWLVLFLTTGFVFTLLFVTAWRGRLWCGWACPQTVFLEGLYRPIERLFDGPRERRLKLAGARWTGARVLRLAGKHASWLLISLLISHAALSLFTSFAGLEQMVVEGPAAHPAAFAWAVSVTGLLHFNFTWFREQLCVVLCPYGRLQSLLHDRDSIVIGYDPLRGEPRGRPRPHGPATGDCIDCRRCVTACPNAIDIRDGQQMECLACAQCVDACDAVMDRLHKPRGLIRHARLSSFEATKDPVAPGRRPRLLLYGALALGSFAALGFTLHGRTAFEANILRVPGAPWVLEGSTVRNQLELHLINKTGAKAALAISIRSPVPAQIHLTQPNPSLGPFEDRRVQVVATIERAQLTPGLELAVQIEDQATGQQRTQQVRFLAPPPAASGR